MAKKSSRILSLILALVLVASWAISASALSVSVKKNSAVVTVCTCGDTLFTKKSTVTIKNNGDQAILVKCQSSNAKSVKGNIWSGVRIMPGCQMSFQITTSFGKSAVTKLKVTSYDPDYINFSVTGKKTGAISWS